MMSRKAVPFDEALEFLRLATDFKLGHLPTEMRHPETHDLSSLALNNLPEALTLLHSIELAAVRTVAARGDQIDALARDIAAVFSQGGRIFLAGCGSTGRLSLTLETLWRASFSSRSPSHPESVSLPIALREKVVSFMAGGDYALVRSIENFEDHPEYGARQLREAGFSAGDLLIASSEGGETPFVIGAVREAVTISQVPPYFVFCNPKTDLLTIERSREVLLDARVKSLSLSVGPMALAGSTRLQASTALLLAIGSALFSAAQPNGGQHASDLLFDFAELLASYDFKSLIRLIELEAAIYSRGDLCMHQSRDYALSVLTDTTERTPTFSLMPFENSIEPLAKMSWTYLNVPQAESATEAWQTLLHRSPRAILWPNLAKLYGRDVINGFDFHSSGYKRRMTALRPGQRQHTFSIDSKENLISFQLDDTTASFERPVSPLFANLIVKCAMNFSSTLVMGRLGRFQNNLMLFVKATNNKLIDRSVRYVQILLEDEGIKQFTYEDIVHVLFEERSLLMTNESIVLKVVARLKSAHTLLLPKAAK